MLTDAQKSVITATVPVLAEHGVALITHFYGRMLKYNPELQQVFNITHQRTGHQARALASAVLAYAQHIDNPAVLQKAVTHIAHKHVSVGIRAEHYPIVGHHLIESIREVLGEAASPSIIEAWTAAYEQLAQIMIAAEGTLYSEAACSQGGWSGWRSFVITEKCSETDDVVSLLLKPVDGGSVMAVKPGQYVSVRLFLREENMVQPRQYTVTQSGTNHLRITVKHVSAQGSKPEGMVSKALHASPVGTVVDVSAPAGELTLPEGRTPVVFISAGIGVTPIVAMLKTIEETREVVHLHVCRTSNDFVLRNEVEAAMEGRDCRTLHVCYTQGKGRPDVATYGTLVRPEADYVICGPDGFMKDVVHTLTGQGVPADKLHIERFSVG